MSLQLPGVADSLQQEVAMQRLRRDPGEEDSGGAGRGRAVTQCFQSCSPTPARLPLLLPPSSTVSAWAQLLLWCGESAPSAGHEEALQLHAWLIWVWGAIAAATSGHPDRVPIDIHSSICQSIYIISLYINYHHQSISFIYLSIAHLVYKDSAGVYLCGPQQPTTPGTRILFEDRGAVTPIEKERWGVALTALTCSGERETCPHPMKPSCLEEVGLDLCSEGGKIPSLKDWQTDKRRPDQEALPTLHRGLLRQLHFAQVSSASTASDLPVGGGGCLPQMIGSLADPLECVCVCMNMVLCLLHEKLWKDCSKAKLMARNALNKIEKLSKQSHHFGFRMTPSRRDPSRDGRVARGPW
ncbi:hypothetical protein E2320_004450 [Naja naja]|nr:hypothetical protein E2320_004450 [Naja naja]